MEINYSCIKYFYYRKPKSFVFFITVFFINSEKIGVLLHKHFALLISTFMEFVHFSKQWIFNMTKVCPLFIYILLVFNSVDCACKFIWNVPWYIICIVCYIVLEENITPGDTNKLLFLSNYCEYGYLNIIQMNTYKK